MNAAEPVGPARPRRIVDPIEDPGPGDTVSSGDRPDPFAAGLGKEPDED